MTPRLEWDANTDNAQRAARVVALGALDDVADAYTKIHRRDSDSIHDFRVALRRLRSWIHAYRPCLDDTLRKRTRRGLKCLARATRDVRDLDTQIAWLKCELDAQGDVRAVALTWIVMELERERRPAWRKLRKLLRRDFAVTKTRLQKELRRYIIVHDVRDGDYDRSMKSVTASLLNAQSSALAAALDRVRSADDSKRLHRARILAKRTRYVLDELSSGAAGMTSAAGALTRFQDVVGELRDAQLLAHRVAREVAAVAAERTAIVASEMVYGPSESVDFRRVTTDSPFDASLSLLFARLHDRIAAGERAVTEALAPGERERLAGSLRTSAKQFGDTR